MTERWTSYGQVAPQVTDLHDLAIWDADTGAERLGDHGRDVVDCPVRVVFHNIEAQVVRFIAVHDVVIGCAAWLTSEPILGALATRRGVSILVQKEDFLRPDAESQGDWRRQLRASYARLPHMDRPMFPGLVESLCTFSDPTLAPVRCVGCAGKGQREIRPRMHHKFLVGCSYEPGPDGQWGMVEPEAVWTGSFNFTKNSTRSFENGLLIPDQRVAEAYYAEWAQLVALSEPLDWESEWVCPEWRVGT